MLYSNVLHLIMEEPRPVYLTQEALEKLKADLRNARIHERARIAREIAEARAHGDLSENAEYDAAKDAQGKLEARIAQMETTLGNARILDETQIDTSKAYILSTVQVRNMRTRNKQRFKLVSAPEADIARGLISIKSPIGKGLLGRAVGDTVSIAVPAGTVSFEILEVTRD